jgi:hypothetical protein
MRLSTSNSFLAFLRIKAGIASAVSMRMRLFVFGLFLAGFLVSMTVIFGFIPARRQASAQISEGQKVVIPFHLTAADGIKTLAQLRAASGESAALPQFPVSRMRITTSGSSAPLKWHGIPNLQPEGWELTFDRRCDFSFPTTYVPQPLAPALDFISFQSTGICDGIVTFELFPSEEKPPGESTVSEAYRLTPADSFSTIKDLVLKYSDPSTFGDFPLASVQLYVSAASTANVTFIKMARTAPEFFEFGFLPGGQGRWEVPKITRPLLEALGDYQVRIYGDSTAYANVLFLFETKQDATAGSN